MADKREIYSISYNKVIMPDGTIRPYLYTLGKVSINSYRIPESIVLKGEKITVTFTDGCRHILHYNNDVELFDRILETKIVSNGE